MNTLTPEEVMTKKELHNYLLKLLNESNEPFDVTIYSGTPTEPKIYSFISHNFFKEKSCGPEILAFGCFVPDPTIIGTCIVSNPEELERSLNEWFLMLNDTITVNKYNPANNLTEE